MVDICLPVEILIAIVEEVDDIQDLRHLRVVSHALCAVATPLAFLALPVITTNSSAQNLGRFFDLPDIAAHVKEVYYHDTGVVVGGRMLECGAFSPPSSQSNILTCPLHLRRRVSGSVNTEAIDELASSFSRIHQLPRLETIKLEFTPIHDNYWPGDSDSRDRLSLQASILGSLAASFSVRASSKLTSLSLLNIRASDPTPLETLPLQNILPTLQCLQLSAVSDISPDPGTFRDRWHYFWSTLSSCMVPVQTQIVLTELTLHSDKCVGVFDGLLLPELHFPRLAVLSLRNIVFNPIQDEVFVLRHAATLVRLELLTCKVLLSMDRHPAPAPSKYTNLAGEGEIMRVGQHWDRIWDRFTAELTAVVKLNVDECDSDEEVRYVHPRIGAYSYSMICADESRNAADLAALQRFRMTVAARSTEARVES